MSDKQPEQQQHQQTFGLRNAHGQALFTLTPGLMKTKWTPMTSQQRPLFGAVNARKFTMIPKMTATIPVQDSKTVVDNHGIVDSIFTIQTSSGQKFEGQAKKTTFILNNEQQVVNSKVKIGKTTLDTSNVSVYQSKSNQYTLIDYTNTNRCGISQNEQMQAQSHQVSQPKVQSHKGTISENKQVRTGERHPQVVMAGGNIKMMPKYMDIKMSEGVSITDYKKFKDDQKENDLLQKFNDYSKKNLSFLQKMIAPALTSAVLATIVFLPVPVTVAAPIPHNLAKPQNTVNLPSMLGDFPDLDNQMYLTRGGYHSMVRNPVNLDQINSVFPATNLETFDKQVQATAESAFPTVNQFIYGLVSGAIITGGIVFSPILGNLKSRVDEEKEKTSEDYATMKNGLKKGWGEMI